MFTLGGRGELDCVHVGGGELDCVHVGGKKRTAKVTRKGGKFWKCLASKRVHLKSAKCISLAPHTDQYLCPSCVLWFSCKSYGAMLAYKSRQLACLPD